MRPPKRIANRYARALADMTMKRGEVEKVEDELRQFAELFEPGSEAYRVLTAPSISLAQRVSY